MDITYHYYTIPTLTGIFETIKVEEENEKQKRPGSRGEKMDTIMDIITPVWSGLKSAHSMGSHPFFFFFAETIFRPRINFSRRPQYHR